ncbi:MAG: DegQ family serine endoprotease [Planctomycetales bacterium]|nr:DegQ family serine endoprotease [Planctomycetales bacterium]
MKRTIVIWTTVVMISLLNAGAWGGEQDTNGIETLRRTGKAFSAVAKKTTPAVVAVQVRAKISTLPPGLGYGSPFDSDFFERFFGQRIPRTPQQPRERWREGQASGFIISPDGYVLTNNHVIDGADEIAVLLDDGRKFEKVKLVGSDDKTDVALLKIEDVDGLPSVALGDSDALEIGEWVIAIGNPFGLTETLTVGVVSGLRRNLGGEGFQDFIQTDAAINPGNSGGPLLNLNGEVVGINAAIVTGDGGYMGVGLAVPINMAKAIKEQLIATGKVQRGYLGISMQDISADMADFFKLKDSKGALVTDVSEDSAAEKAGLLKDDVIIQIGNKKINDLQDVRNIIGFTAPNTTVEITILRNGKEKKVTVTVGSQEESELASTSDVGRKLGLTVLTIDKEVAGEYNIAAGKGVVVSEVEADSAAHYAGLQQGMVILEVNRTAVNTVGEFNAAITESETSRKVLLLVKVGQYARYAVLSLEE